MLVVLDEYPTKCHMIQAGFDLDSEGMIETLEGLYERNEAVGHIRSDNGSEFGVTRLRAS